MNLQSLTVSIGPTLQSRHTHVRLIMDFDTDELLRITQDTAGMARRLLAASRAMGLELDIETLNRIPVEGALSWFGEWFVSLGIAMQRQGRHPVEAKWVRFDLERNRLDAGFEHEVGEVGQRAAQLSLALMAQALPALDWPAEGIEQGADLEALLQVFLDEAGARVMPADTRALMAAAGRAGVPAVSLERFPYEPIQGDFRIRPNGMVMLGHAAERKILDGNLYLERSPRAVSLARDINLLGQALVHYRLPLVREGVSLEFGSTYHLVVAGHRLLLTWNEDLKTRHEGDVEAGLVETAEQIARELDVGLMVLSIRSEDPGVALERNGGLVLNLQVAPEFDRFLEPTSAALAEIMDAFVEWLVPAGPDSRLPTLAFTGDQRATQASSIASHVTEHAGYRTALVNSTGRWFRGEREEQGPDAILLGHYRAMESPFTQMLVLEANARGTAVFGYPMEQFSVVVDTGGPPDVQTEPWLHGHDERAAMRSGLLARAVRGVVLNADDTDSNVGDGAYEAVRLGLFSASRTADELAGRGAAVTCTVETVEERQTIAFTTDGGTLPVAELSEIGPPDELTPSRMDALLAAATACWMQGLSTASIGEALRRSTTA